MKLFGAVPAPLHNTITPTACYCDAEKAGGPGWGGPHHPIFVPLDSFEEALHGAADQLSIRQLDEDLAPAGCGVAARAMEGHTSPLLINACVL